MITTAAKIINEAPDATSAINYAKHLYRASIANDRLKGLTYYRFSDESVIVACHGDLFAYGCMTDAQNAFRRKA